MRFALSFMIFLKLYDLFVEYYFSFAVSMLFEADQPASQFEQVKSKSTHEIEYKTDNRPT